MNFQSAFVMTPDPIYVKMLPGGEATPLVDDRRVKRSPRTDPRLRTR